MVDLICLFSELWEVPLFVLWSVCSGSFLCCCLHMLDGKCINVWLISFCKPLYACMCLHILHMCLLLTWDESAYVPDRWMEDDRIIAWRASCCLHVGAALAADSFEQTMVLVLLNWFNRSQFTAQTNWFVMPARRSDGEGQKAAPAMAESRSQEDAAQAAFKQPPQGCDRSGKNGGIRTDVTPLVNMESQK